MPIVPWDGPHPFAKPRIIIGYRRPPTPKAPEAPGAPGDGAPEQQPIKRPEGDR